MENKISRWAVIVLAATCMLLLGACSYPYNKDRPYDPNFTSEQLADQIPNWEGEALERVEVRDRYDNIIFVVGDEAVVT